MRRSNRADAKFSSPVAQAFRLARTAAIGAACLGAPVVLAGCAQTSPPATWVEPLTMQAPTVGVTANAPDTFEGFNRKVYAVNHALDMVLLKPLAQAYRGVVPVQVRVRVHNMLNNLDEPVVFLNQVLQGQLHYAGYTFVRFVGNSTFGVAGMNDLATPLGILEHSGDFGQTLAVYGFNSGAYLYLPLFGPSTVRDGVGQGVDTVSSPWGYLTPTHYSWVTYTHLGVQAVDARERALERIDALERSSIDPYASLRSLYLQYRDAEVRRIDQSDAATSPVNGDDFDLPPSDKNPTGKKP